MIDSATLEELRGLLQLAYAYNRARAAQLMGISRRKLEGLIASGRVKIAAGDPHLVPASEVRRYCEPRPARVRALRQPRRIEGSSDEEIEAYRRSLRSDPLGRDRS